MFLFAFIVLLVLKLAHVVSWAWWIIFSPLIAAGALFVGAFAFGLGVFSVIDLVMRKGLRR